MIPRPTYIASCSFGKDSIATILLALEHNEPLDRVVFSEVMFDHARDISGEIPEHIGWIYNTAIPKLHNMGVHVDVVRAERDYRYFFANAVGGGRHAGKIYGFPLGGKCFINRDCKIAPIRKYLAEIAGGPLRAKTNIVQYVGIAADEPRRLAKLRLHRADGEMALRRSRVTVADLHNRDTRRMLVLPELQNTTFRQPATQSSRTMGRIGRVEPYAELVQLRIQIRPYRAGDRKTDGRRRATTKTFLTIKTFIIPADVPGNSLRSKSGAHGLKATKKPDRIAVNSWCYRMTVSISTSTTYA